MTCPFEVGKKYRFRGLEGWAKFLMHVPEAKEDSRAVFVTDTGRTLLRYENGSFYRPNAINEWDILPEEYTEPKKVTYYQAVFNDNFKVYISGMIFKSEDDAKNHGRTSFVRLLTEYPIEIEE